jgi:hypothetical protein
VHIAAKRGCRWTSISSHYQAFHGVADDCRLLATFSPVRLFRRADVAANCFAAVRNELGTGNCLLPVGKGISAA